MKKLIMLTLLVCVGLTSFSMNYETYNMVNERVMEMKTELKKELHKKKYGNEVMGSFEVKGKKIHVSANMIERKGKPRQESFQISETRRISDFKLISSTKYNLPKISIDEKKPLNMAKAMGTMLFLLGMMFITLGILGKKKKLKKKEKKLYIVKRRAA